MECLFILLRGNQGLEESLVQGLLTGLFFVIVFAIYAWIKSSIHKKKKKWDDVSKEETSQTKDETDWN